MLSSAECGADPLLVNSQGKSVLELLQEQGRRADIQCVIKASIQPSRYRRPVPHPYSLLPLPLRSIVYSTCAAIMP